MAVTVRGTDILFNDGTTQSTAAGASTYVGARSQIYSAAGSYTFTIPTGITALKITVVGGGGGSGPASGGDQGGGNGGAGGAAISYLSGLTPGNTIAVTVGAAGSAGIWSGNAGSGGTSSVSSGTQAITTMSATGGTGGTANGYSIVNLGGVGSGGTINTRGAPGFFATSLMQGGSSELAIGPSIKAFTNVNSIAGTFGSGAVGGWEGGSTVRNGSAGGAGVVMFEW